MGLNNEPIEQPLWAAREARWDDLRAQLRSASGRRRVLRRLTGALRNCRTLNVLRRQVVMDLDPPGAQHPAVRRADGTSQSPGRRLRRCIPVSGRPAVDPPDGRSVQSQTIVIGIPAR